MSMPNALVQLQAHYHHCGEAASEKCLSAATFVRWRAALNNWVRSERLAFEPLAPVVINFVAYAYLSPLRTTYSTSAPRAAPIAAPVTILRVASHGSAPSQYI